MPRSGAGFRTARRTAGPPHATSVTSVTSITGATHSRPAPCNVCNVCSVCNGRDAQPGRPIPHGEGHSGSPNLEAFHSTKSAACRFSEAVSALSAPSPSSSSSLTLLPSVHSSASVEPTFM